MKTLDLQDYHKNRLHLKNMKKEINKDELYFLYCKSKESDYGLIFLSKLLHNLNKKKEKYLEIKKKFEIIAKEYINNVKNDKYINDVEYEYDNTCEDYYLNNDKEKYFDVYNIFKYHYYDYNYQFDSYNIEYDYKDPDRDKKRRSQLKNLRKQLEKDYIYFLFQQLRILKKEKNNESVNYNEMDEAYTDFIDTRNKYLRIKKEKSRLKKVTTNTNTDIDIGVDSNVDNENV